jgi:hypothetical protein
MAADYNYKYTRFLENNDLLEFESGGKLDIDIVCKGCSWKWNTRDSEEDKYICHNCGFDNTLYYTDIMSTLKQPKTLEQIAEIHGITDVEGAQTLTKQLEKGIKTEMEHTTDEIVAKTIALHHIEEMPDYYDKLEEMGKGEKIVKFVEAKEKMLEGGLADDEGNLINFEVGDTIVEYKRLTPNQPKREYGGNGKIVSIVGAMAKVVFQPNNYEQWIALKDMKKVETTDKLKDGGVVVGKRHSESDENGTGERFLVKSTGQVVELEGGEGVLNTESMQSTKTFDFNGNKMTARQIASELNHKYGGVEFAKGGNVKHVCGCKSNKFYHGGELPTATVDSLQGGEAVVTVKTMESKDKYNFNGKEMTPRKVLSKINREFGGKSFEDGGTIDLSKHKFAKELKMTKMVYFVENVLYL